MAEKLLKQIKLNKRATNGLMIVGLQAYGEKAYRDKEGYNKKSPYYNVTFYFLKDYKGHKSHEKLYGHNELLRLSEIQKEMKRIIGKEWILSQKGQKWILSQGGKR